MAGTLPDSLFIGSEAVGRDIKLGDGTVHPLKFRPLRARDLAKFYSMDRSDPESTQDAMTAAIAASVVDDDGKPVLTIEQADRLKPAVRNEIMRIVNEVNSPHQGNA